MKLPRLAWIVGRAFGLGSAAMLAVASDAEDADACVACMLQDAGGHWYWTCGTYNGPFGSAGLYCQMTADTCKTVGYCSG